jgi:hypothetical protein
VTGRFQAWAKPRSGAPRLVDESPSIRWRHSAPPPQSTAAVAAVETLLEQLAEQGWEVTQHGDETWYGYVLSGPADVADQPRFVAVPQEHARAAFPDPLRPERAEAPGEPESRREPRPESKQEARPESKREARVEPHQIRRTDGEPHETQRAESERPDDAEVRVSTVAAQPAARTRRPPVAFAVYALAVAGTAAVFLVGFHSGYAASVAALTAVALSLGIDSLRVARRQAVPPPHAQPPRSQNP